MEGRDGMNDEAAQRKLRALIDTARASGWASGRIVNPVEIASHAREAGLDISESLTVVRKYAGQNFGSADSALEAALAFFVCSLASGEKTSRVLEYTADDRLRVAGLTATDGSEISVFARDAQFADVLSVLLADASASISVGIPVPAANAQFDTIICAPPIGLRSKGGDGFGSEVVSALAPNLSDDGLLCWITARGVLANRQARSTFPALAKNGLHVAADRTAVIRQRSDQPVEVVELVQYRQTATALSAGNSDQNFMAGFCDINRHQNRLALCNSGLGHSRSPLWCGLCKTTVRT